MPCDLLIVGGGGDLAYRKLYPALFHLDKGGRLPECVRAIGIARRALTREEFLTQASDRRNVTAAAAGAQDAAWTRFTERLHYQNADATNLDAMRSLRQQYFDDPDRGLIIYLATPPSIFGTVSTILAQAGIVRANTRLVLEKPLGDSLASFREISRQLSGIFEERQIYRIDHYLGKETVQNLLVLRFANTLMEPLWNSKHIDHVQITVAETMGAGGRWAFYDEAGALRDMVQNHLLQLLCLVAMEPPAKLDANSVRDEKLKVLRSLRPMDRASVARQSVRGQYQAGAVAGKIVCGYDEESDAKPGSTTETFVALRAEIDNWRWAGVPFYLRTGKRMPHRCAEIAIQFKAVPHWIFSVSPATASPNRLVMRLQPDEGICLELMNKVPGIDVRKPLQAVSLDLSFTKVFANQRGSDAYERLLLEVMRDNPTLFVRADEVEVAWRWIDEIVAGWNELGTPVRPYAAGSWGPAESVALTARDGRAWHDIESP